MNIEELKECIAYNEKYDSYYNSKTNEWLEQTCSDAECEYCKDRPDKAPTE
jgi:hypothetical protein